MGRTMLRFGGILLLGGLMIAFGSYLVIGEMNEMVGGGIAPPFTATPIGESDNYTIDTMGLSFIFEGEMVKNGLNQSKEAMQNWADKLYDTVTKILEKNGYL